MLGVDESMKMKGGGRARKQINFNKWNIVNPNIERNRKLLNGFIAEFDLAVRNRLLRKSFSENIYDSYCAAYQL